MTSTCLHYFAVCDDTRKPTATIGTSCPRSTASCAQTKSLRPCVQRQLLEVIPPGAEVILLAGLRYRKDIQPFLQERGFSVAVPLEGMKIGEQLHWLKEQVP